MPTEFDNAPEDVPQGDYGDSVVDANRTVEEWITATVLEDGERVDKAFGFILLPREEVAWRKKSEVVQECVAAAGHFDSLEYFMTMMEYQVQQTSFGVSPENIRTWLSEANDEILSQLEEFVPSPVDVGDDEATEYVDDLIDRYVRTEGDPSDSVAAFREWVHQEAGGEEGKLGLSSEGAT